MQNGGFVAALAPGALVLAAVVAVPQQWGWVAVACAGFLGAVLVLAFRRATVGA